MITIMLDGSSWNNAQIKQALDILMSTGGGAKHAYFYINKVVIARRLSDMRYVLATADKDELMGKDEYFDVIDRVRKEIHNALIRFAEEMDKELPAGAD